MKTCAVLLLALLLISAVSPASAETAPVTRGSFAVLLWQSDGSVPCAIDRSFADVPPDASENEAISWVHAQGLMWGVGEGLFAPECAITREEAAVILRRYAALWGRDTFYPTGVAACNDYDGISHWADDALYWGTGCGLIDWSPGGLMDPQGVFTPIQAAELVYRFATGSYLQ